MSAVFQTEAYEKLKNINWETYKGRRVCTVSLHWPDGTRFRRRFRSEKLALEVLGNIRAAIWAGTWQELKANLKRKKVKPVPVVQHTIASLAPIYKLEWAKEFTTDYSARMIDDVVRLIPLKPIATFSKADALDFRVKRLAEGVEPSTVNKGLIAISALFEFAKLKGLVTKNPMEGSFTRKASKGKIALDIKKKVRQVLRPWEVDRIVTEALRIDYVVGVYIATLAATGLRRQEGLHLKRKFFDLEHKQLVLDVFKGFKPRIVPIPLTARLIELYRDLPEIVGNDYVFVRLSTGKRMKWPNDVFEEAKKAAGILWPTLHDLRRYRATQWLRDKMDITNVRDYLGHHSVKVTEGYLIYVEDQAAEDARRCEAAELAAIERHKAANGVVIADHIPPTHSGEIRSSGNMEVS